MVRAEAQKGGRNETVNVPNTEFIKGSLRSETAL